LVVLAAFAIASVDAPRRFERAITHGVATGKAPLEVGRGLLARGRASLALWIAGVTSLLTVCGALLFVFGMKMWNVQDYPGQGLAPIVAASARHVALAVGLIVIGAIVVGRAVRGTRLLAHGAALASATAALLATLCVGLWFDPGNMYTIAMQGRAPSEALRLALTLAAAGAWFVIVAGLALRRRRGDGGP
jgi:hypothetical protein